MHQIPPKPDYFRVKIGRRLQRIGAMAIKNSVYVLPNRPDTLEDVQWVLREITEGGGEAMICEAELVEGLGDRQVRELFDEARAEAYREIAAEAKALLKSIPARPRLTSTLRAQAEQEHARLRRRLEAAAAIDFFGAPGRGAADERLAEVEAGLRASARSRTGKRGGSSAPRGRTWVTRRDVKVDRISSAWLIRRFIDPDARLKFVDPTGYAPAPGELRFDMFEAEYTHEGDACTFETLLRRLGPDDPALRQVAEIVHDVDCKDAKFGREEAPGIARLIRGIARAHASDEKRIERGSPMFEHLYASFGGEAGT